MIHLVTFCYVFLHFQLFWTRTWYDTYGCHSSHHLHWFESQDSKTSKQQSTGSKINEDWNLAWYCTFYLNINLSCILPQNYASSLALTLITQSLFHGIVKVGFLAYFIYKTPNLCNFVMNSFRHNLVTPINDLGTSCVVSFRPTEPNKIDVIAHMYFQI